MGAEDAIIGEALAVSSRTGTPPQSELDARLEERVATRTADLEREVGQLRALIDALPSMIGYWDKDLENRIANDVYSKWFGVTPKDLAGTNLQTLLGPDLFEKNRPHVEAVLRGEPQTFERIIPWHGGGGVRHSLAHYAPDLHQGEVRGFFVLVHDLTEIVEARLALAASQRDNEALLKTLHQHAIVSVTDRAGRITEVSATFCEISGYSREELIGQTHRVVNSTQQKASFWVNMWKTVMAGQPWRGEVCNRAKDGSLYWVDSIISPFYGDDGRIDKYVSIRTDITARKRAEADLLGASSLLKAVLAAASETSVIATNPEGLITLFNAGAERMLGYGADEMVGKSSPAPLHRLEEIEQRGAELTAEHQVPISGFEVLVYKPTHCGPEAREWTYVRKDGSTLPVLITITAMRDERGAISGYLGVAQDICTQKAEEQMLREAAEEARRASSAKSRFLANMSHEIRTPLNAVIGLTYLLERTTLDLEQTGFIGKIKIAGKSLLSTINDVLDVSKIEAAELELEECPFDLHTLLAEITDLAAVQAEAKQLSFVLRDETKLTQMIVGDPARLHQILTNLASNAIKFTEQGTVRLCAQASVDGDAVALRFTVEDTGIGIPAEAITRIFTPFVQADASTTRRFGGTGLGLSIVKQLTELMGGRVGVDSTPGEGSTFWVEISCPISPQSVVAGIPDTESRLGTALAGIRVLVADDSVINLEVAKRVLVGEGASVALAHNGRDAVHALVADPGAFDIVLMDLQMPVLDGFDATRRIRRGLGLTMLPIVALTAGVLSSEQQQARLAGMSDLLTKPFAPEELIRCIRRHVPRVSNELIEIPGAPSSMPHGWPEIAGIDARDASKRLGGDTKLFRAMMKCLFSEVADIELEPKDATAMDDLAKRLHNIKGSTATLGATVIARMAADAEAACMAHDTERATAAMSSLAKALDGLQTSSAGLLDDRDHVLAEAPCPDAPLDEAVLSELLSLLGDCDLAALDCFERMTPQLQRRLGGTAYSAVRARIEDLRFGPALTILEPMRVQAR